MKQKNSELVAYIFWAAFAVIITGIIIYYIKNFINNTEHSTNHIVNAAQEISEDYSDYEFTKYDMEEVRGSEVINFIKKSLGEYSATEVAPIYVQVITVTSGTTYTNQYTNKLHIPDIKNFSINQYFIKPTAWFYGEVIKTKNQAILGVKFTQK